MSFKELFLNQGLENVADARKTLDLTRRGEEMSNLLDMKKI